MTTRVLPFEDWHRLDGTELEILWPRWQRGDAVVLVVEDDDGRIVGCWSFYRQWCAEGLWIAPTHRGKGGVFRALLRGMKRLAHGLGMRALVTGCMSPLVADLLAKWHAVKLPGDLYVFSPEGK